MALHPCAELFFRLLFEILLYFKDNWLSVLILILIVSFIAKMVRNMILLIGLIASFLNIGIDLLLGATFGTSTILTVMGAIAIGVLWVSMVNSSHVNSLIKIINIPIVFVLGFIWGVYPMSVPVSLILGIIITVALRYRITNYAIGFFPSILTILFLWFAGPTMCSFLNFVIKFLS